MKVTKRQLRRIIREERSRLTENPEVPDVMGAIGGGKFQPRATASGHTARADELFDARDNLLGLIELLSPEEIAAYVDSLIDDLESIKRGA